MNKTLISYFSATSNTKKVATKISEILDADLFEIVPVNKYKNDDLDWTNKNSRSTIEMEDDSSRPEIKKKIENIDEYDTIILGFPVWWYKEPKIINSFMEENDLSGKKVYVFVTSGSSKVDGSLNNLRKEYPNINFVSGRRFSLNINELDIKDWIK